MGLDFNMEKHIRAALLPTDTQSAATEWLAKPDHQERPNPIFVRFHICTFCRLTFRVKIGENALFLMGS